MIGHDHEAYALARHALELMIEIAKHDAFGMIEVEQFSSPIHREREKEYLPVIFKASTSVARVGNCEFPLCQLQARSFLAKMIPMPTETNFSGLTKRCLLQTQVASNRGHPATLVSRRARSPAPSCVCLRLGGENADARCTLLTEVSDCVPKKTVVRKLPRPDRPPERIGGLGTSRYHRPTDQIQRHQYATSQFLGRS